MASVIGYGGVFVRSSRPHELAQWYRAVLGFDIEDEGLMTIFPAARSSTYEVFSVFDSESTYIGDPLRQHVMVNFRVDDLVAFVALVHERGAEVEPIEDGPYGRFAWTHDCDGNRIELWQPPESDSSDESPSR